MGQITFYFHQRFNPRQTRHLLIQEAYIKIFFLQYFQRFMADRTILNNTTAKWGKSLFIVISVSIPDRPGICSSRKKISKSFFFNISSASWPLLVVSPSYPPPP